MLHKLVEKASAALKAIVGATDDQSISCLLEELIKVRQTLALKIAEETQWRIHLEKQEVVQPVDKERSLDIAFEITRLRHSAEALEREIQNKESASRNPLDLEPRMRSVVLGALMILIAIMCASTLAR
ncbi:MAG: hypothetical protein K2X93_21620 [Candidatus Obscuribacterales bacterium]|nr:hypothetical protein [Candidatus Obscuribacterales bacterium]